MLNFVIRKAVKGIALVIYVHFVLFYGYDWEIAQHLGTTVNHRKYYAILKNISLSYFIVLFSLNHIRVLWTSQ